MTYDQAIHAVDYVGRVLDDAAYLELADALAEMGL
jgi:hypothetical protein